MIYRRRASPLHAARAAAGGAYCLALAVAALAFEHPVMLAAAALAATAAGVLARVGRDLARVAAFVVPLVVLIALVNPLVVRDGLTVFARLGEVPPFGELDLTVEALVYGLLLGARVAAVVLCGALFSAAIDPDGVLRLLGRVSFRSALTAALATRLVPVLARDGRRMADAARCRARPAPRVAVLGAVAGSALDRAVDVAATLEVRGYGGRRAPARGGRGAGAPWSRHDVAFMAAAIGIVALVVVGKAAGVAQLTAYPRLEVPLGAREAVLAGAVVLVALLPFASRRGIER
jgi:energy-coupling factor transport system permease protein